MPQKLEHDVDLNTLPLVLFNFDAAAHQKKAPKSKAWIRRQAVLFPTVICSLVALFWQVFLHPRFVLRTFKKNWADLVFMMGRWAFIYGYMASQFGFFNAAIGNVFVNAVGATYIFVNFAVSHTHLPVVKADDDVSWVIYAAKHTMNVSQGPFKFVSWWMSYLNYQIEHHLFPAMPQFRHPQVSKEVKALFQKHGIPYLRTSYTEALNITFSNLDHVGHAFYG